MNSQSLTLLLVYNRRSNTAPYLLILFFALHATAAAIDLLSDASASRDDSSATAGLPGDILRLLLSVALTWIAGSLPLRDALPCSNVATDSDVSNAFTFIMMARCDAVDLVAGPFK